MKRSLCRKCGILLDQVLSSQGLAYHPSCEPDDVFNESFLGEVKQVIRWADANSARSTQSQIGPSEIGDPCDRKIAYRLAGVAEANQWSDPLPAIVGTAFHAWFEKAINSYQYQHCMDRWETELTVYPDPLIMGHTDLYDRQRKAIIDVKTLSPTRVEEWKRSGPKEIHKDQVNMYAKGTIASGRPVETVALLGVPRSGWLRDVQLWFAKYDPRRAEKALSRMYSIADKLIEQGDQIDFSTIPATSGHDCSYCPWYRGSPQRQADLTGCPGDSTKAEGKFGKGLIPPKNDI